MRDAADPFSLSPQTPYSTWTPAKGNVLVSSKYCRTLLPPNFESKELSLAELIDIALQNNPTTRQTWAQARAAAAQYGESLSAFMPDVEFSGSYVRQKGSFVNLGSAIAFFTTQTGPDVSLSYTLFDFGQRSSAAIAAREALYYADLNHNQQIQTVIQAVMDDYYDYLYQLAVLKANEADLMTAQTSLDVANEKFSLGLAALGDVAQARTQFLQSKINLTTQRQNAENAFAQLAVDLGLQANLPFQVLPMPEQVMADPILASVEELIAKAQQQRQDFLAEQANVRSQEATLLGAKRSMLPVFATDWNVGHYWFQKGQVEQDIHWTVQFSLDFPIFDGFSRRNQIRNAEAEVELSRAQLLQTELAVVQAVTTAHRGVKTAAQNLADTAEYLKAAELEFKIALTSYKSGTATILDLISAQSSLTDARSKKAGAQKDWFTSLATLAYATGSLCSSPSTPSEAACEN